MSEQNTALTTLTQNQEVTVHGAFANITAFTNAQRMATALASSALVPTAYQKNTANCLVALEVAQRTGSSILAVMQNLNIIHGKPSWSSTYVIGAINSSGLFDRLRFELTGEGDKRQCVAYAKEKATGDVLKGPAVSIAMAKAEGWFQKSGSKWQTMPELMLQYRAAAFFGRLYVPDLLMGMQSEDELRDVTPDAQPAPDQAGSDTLKNLNAKIDKAAKPKKAVKTEAKPVEVIDIGSTPESVESESKTEAPQEAPAGEWF